jgi:hypothetical protein
MDIQKAISLFASPLEQTVKSTPSLHFYKNFIIRELNGKKFLVIQQDRIKESREFMLSEEIKGLEINMSLGYPLLDINFLKEFTFITDLNIVHQPLKDTTVLNLLQKLQYLGLDSYFYQPLDFDNFPDLHYCSLHWTQNAINLFSRTSLKELHLRSYQSKDLSHLSKLSELETFSLVQSPVSTIIDLKSLPNLKKLKLSLLRNLTSLHGIEYLKKLESLEIRNCAKIESIEEMGNAVNLKELFLIDCKDIQSIKPISKLDKLDSLIFSGTTNIVDGNLKFLTQLKNLKKIIFQNRKHYSHKVNLLTYKLMS